MYRIDNSSAVPTMPAVGPAGTPGFFTDGNPAAALEATIVDGWWCNILQEEILTVVTAAGIAPNKASHTQLYEALNTLYAGGTPVTGFLPIIGGELYNGGAGNLLGLRTSGNQDNYIIYRGTRTWLAGVRGADGWFTIYDEAAGNYRLWIDANGRATIGTLGLSDPLIITSGNGGSARIQYNITGMRQWLTGQRADGWFECYDQTAGFQRLGIDPGGRVHIGGGGTAGLSDPLLIEAGGGASGRIEYSVAARTWSAGVRNDGWFEFYDHVAAIQRLGIDPNGRVHVGGTGISGVSDPLIIEAAVGGSARIEYNTGTRIYSVGLRPDGWFEFFDGVASIQRIGIDINGRVHIGGYGAAGITDPLLIAAVGGASARIQYNTGTRFWTAGVRNDGYFIITDETAGSSRLFIEPSGQVNIGSSGLSDPLKLAGGGGGNVAIYFNLIGTKEWRCGVRNDGLFMWTDISAGADRMWIDGAGNVVIPDLVVSGSFNPPSDRRLKQNIANYQHGLDAVMQLQPVSFQWNGCGAMRKDGRTIHGFVADDIEPFAPEIVGSRLMRIDPEDRDYKPVRSLDQTGLICVLVNAVKELASRVETLERR